MSQMKTVGATPTSDWNKNSHSGWLSMEGCLRIRSLTEGRPRAVRRDIRDSSLYFGPKLARLLSGLAVANNNYCLAVGAKPDSRDPRFIQAIDYGSVVTWQCNAQESIDRKARFVKSKLGEADEQLVGTDAGIVHLAMDADLDSEVSDLRRHRNMETIKTFRSHANLTAIYLHYLVPRVSEIAPWMIDETVDRFGLENNPVPTYKIFQQSVTMDNDLPAWKQIVPLSHQGAR
jgi:hypothetical protein